MPRLEPLDRLMPPARAVSRDLSMASTVTLPPLMVLWAVRLPLALSTVASPWLTSTLTAPAMETLDCSPATEPEMACDASLPAKSPVRFWVSFEVAVTSPFSAMRSPWRSTLAVFLLTLTATPAAMALACFASDMARPRPWV